MKNGYSSLYRYVVIVYAIGVTIVGFLVSPVYFVLLVPIVFLRPVLRELSILKDVDEREVLIIYRSSHIAFYLMLMLLVLIFLNDAFLKKTELPLEWYLLLIVPVFAKFATSIVLNYSLRRAGLTIGWLFGVIWTGFALLSNGLNLAGLMQSLVGISILIATAVATKWRHVGGALLIIEGCLGTILVLRAGWEPLMKLLMSLVMGLPLILAGLFIFASKMEEM